MKKPQPSLSVRKAKSKIKPAKDAKQRDPFARKRGRPRGTTPHVEWVKTEPIGTQPGARAKLEDYPCYTFAIRWREAKQRLQDRQDAPNESPGENRREWYAMENPTCPIEWDSLDMQARNPNLTDNWRAFQSRPLLCSFLDRAAFALSTPDAQARSVADFRALTCHVEITKERTAPELSETFAKALQGVCQTANALEFVVFGLLEGRDFDESEESSVERWPHPKMTGVTFERRHKSTLQKWREALDIVSNRSGPLFPRVAGVPTPSSREVEIEWCREGLARVLADATAAGALKLTIGFLCGTALVYMREMGRPQRTNRKSELALLDQLRSDAGNGTARTNREYADMLGVSEATVSRQRARYNQSPNLKGQRTSARDTHNRSIPIPATVPEPHDCPVCGQPCEGSSQ